MTLAFARIFARGGQAKVWLSAAIDFSTHTAMCSFASCLDREKEEERQTHGLLLGAERRRNKAISSLETPNTLNPKALGP